MGLSVSENRGVFFLSGELDWEGGDDLRVAMEHEPEHPNELVLDLSDVTFIDSMGVRAIVRLSKTNRGGVVLRYPQDALLRVLELLEIDEMPGMHIQID